MYSSRTLNTHTESFGNSYFTKVGILTTKEPTKKKCWVNNTKSILSQNRNKQNPFKPPNTKMSKISKMFKLIFWRGLSLCKLLNLASVKDKKGTEDTLWLPYKKCTCKMHLWNAHDMRKFALVLLCFSIKRNLLIKSCFHSCNALFSNNIWNYVKLYPSVSFKEQLES